jgi:hypothetical protein
VGWWRFLYFERKGFFMKFRKTILLLALIVLMFLSPHVFADQDGDYTYTVSGGNATITAYTGAGGAISIPATLGGFPTVAIGDLAFFGCTSLTSVTIPDSVTTIGSTAFFGCTNLTSIVVDGGNPVFSSQDGVLYDNAKTLLIQYPDGKIGGFTILNSVTSIGEGAFSDCTGLTSVTIGSSVANIGFAAFAGCTGLTSITIPDSVTSIEGHAFLNCTSLTSVTIPGSVTSIGYEAFQYCSSLTKAYFLGNAPSMGSSVFDGCPITICYSAGSTGFEFPWGCDDRCYPTEVCVNTTTTVQSTTTTPSESTTTTTLPEACKILSIQPSGITVGFGLLPRIRTITVSFNVDLEEAGIDAGDLTFENTPKGITILSTQIIDNNIEAVVMFWGVTPGTYNVVIGTCDSKQFVVLRF